MVNAKAVNEKSTFSTACSVTININATPERVWSVLTDSNDIANWNSTIISFEGTIALND